MVGISIVMVRLAIKTEFCDIEEIYIMYIIEKLIVTMKIIYLAV